MSSLVRSTSAEKRVKTHASLKTLATSTVAAELESFTKAQLCLEIDRLKEHVRRGFPVVHPKTSRKDVAKEPAKLRERVFQRIPDLKKTFEDVVKEEYESTTSVESRTQELDHPFYTVETKHAIRNMRYEVA